MTVFAKINILNKFLLRVYAHEIFSALNTGNIINGCITKHCKLTDGTIVDAQYLNFDGMCKMLAFPRYGHIFIISTPQKTKKNPTE